MFIRHSVKNVMRSKKKSLLFFVLIAALVVIMSIGVSLTVTIRDILTECEKSYTTVAKFEYMGASYPDDTEYDSNIGEALSSLDAAAIKNNSATLSWDPTEIALGYVEGRTDVNTLAPFKKNAVLVVHIDKYKKSDVIYSGVIEEVLYSYENVQNLLIYIHSMGFELETDHYYLINGYFYTGWSGYKFFKLNSFENASAESVGFDGSIENMILDVTNEEGGYTLPEDSYFYTVAETYSIINQCVTVQATNDVEALFPFQQSTLYLTDGRYFTDEEYSSGAKVCVLPESLAQFLGLEIGGEFNLSLATQSGSSKNESYWAAKGFSYSENYTVVGLVNDKGDYKNTIYIPKTNAFDFSSNNFSFVLGQATLKNGESGDFLNEINSLLPERVRLTVYDQGYSTVTQPLSDIMRVAIIITCVSAVVGIAVIAVYGYLFVYRQRDSALIMRRLGVKNRNILTYFLFGAGCISLAASLLGAIISASMSGLCMKIIERVVLSYSSGDMLYSNGNLSMVKTLNFATNISLWLFFVTALAVFLLSVISCLLFGIFCIRSHTHRRRKSFIFGSARSRTLNGGPIKYAWLSVKRGYFRALIPVLVSACAVVLLFQLPFTTQSYKTKLNEINANAQIEGHFTDINGLSIGGLSIKGSAISDLYKTGALSKINVSNGLLNYYYVGVSAENGTPVDLPPPDIPPRGTFAWESFIDTVLNGPAVVFTNNIYAVPEFYYSTIVQTEYLDGYDSSFFGKEADGENYYCMVSTDFMEENGVNLGDTIRILELKNNFLTEVDYIVVGSFVKAGSKDNIYCPLAYYISPNILFNAETDSSSLKYYVFNSVSFKLVDGAVLPGFKDYLSEKGYSEVNNIRDIRSFVIIEDKTFLNTASAMKQRIWYMNNTFPVIYAFIEFLAGLIPYILIQMRKREIAIMRGQGATAKTAFYSVFFEQLILCPAGAAIGIAISQIVMKSFNPTGIILGAVYVACWLGGTALSVRHINKGSVRSILKAEE